MALTQPVSIDLDALPPDLGGRIRVLRTARALSREYVAVKIGYSMAAIRRWEANDRAPSIVAARQLAELFDVPRRILLDAPIVGGRQ